ncbi:MAG: chemotaxis protein CheX [Verrucomicrobiota bacterium]|nr:chemotaxis protein CheX [Limisphaera sp.]MDW8380895.1 chemotaxis protein CheX [Verrucomicrobiota bacterium]
MNTVTSQFDVAAFMQQQVRDVFQTMAALEVKPVPIQQDGNHHERISGVVGLGSETITGAVYLHLPLPLAEHITRQLLGLEPTDPVEEAAVNDVTGELTNMVAGGLKSTLCDRGVPCAVSTPTIIRGTAYEIEVLPDVSRYCLSFDAGPFQFNVEAHLKQN